MSVGTSTTYVFHRRSYVRQCGKNNSILRVTYSDYSRVASDKEFSNEELNQVEEHIDAILDILNKGNTK